MHLGVLVGNQPAPFFRFPGGCPPCSRLFRSGLPVGVVPFQRVVSLAAVGPCVFYKMQENIGIGGLKFQSVITSQMKKRSSQFKSNFPVMELKAPDDGFSQKVTTQIQSLKSKIMEKLQSPDQKEQFQQQLEQEKKEERSFDSSSESRSYRLQVSSSSSDESLEMSPLLNESFNEQQRKAQKQFKQLLQRQDHADSTTVRSLQHNTSLSLTRPKHHSMSQMYDKVPITFMRSLKQNQNFNEHDELEEYVVNGKIHIDMECKDIMTFMRLQHEIEEFKRKQDDFNRQKEQHFRKNDQQKQDDQFKNEKWFTAITLAKRFLRNFRMRKRDTNRSQRRIMLSPAKLSLSRPSRSNLDSPNIQVRQPLRKPG